MKTIKLHLGLDVHIGSITIAIAQAGRQGEIRVFGTITNDLHAKFRGWEGITSATPGRHLRQAWASQGCPALRQRGERRRPNIQSR
jgi:hypothetical protein